MIEEELRAAFARHEAETPTAGSVHDKINRAFVRRKRRRTAARAAGVATAVLIAAAAVPVALAEHRPPAPATQNLLGSPAPAQTGGVNFLLLGTDTGPGEDGGRAETMTVVHVPVDRSRIYLISLPPDARVPIPGHGTDQMRSSLAFGGTALSRRVVTKETGLAIDATVLVDTTTLTAITDAVGGVEVCLDRAFTSTRTGKHYRAGCQTLRGPDVAPVLRASHKLDSDDGDRTGQRYLGALVGKLASSRFRTDPAALNSLLKLLNKTGLKIDGPTAELLTVAATMRSAAVVGISEPSVSGGVYPKVGRDLFAATRGDDLASWVAANPSYVLRR